MGRPSGNHNDLIDCFRSCRRIDREDSRRRHVGDKAGMTMKMQIRTINKTFPIISVYFTLTEHTLGNVFLSHDDLVRRTVRPPCHVVPAMPRRIGRRRVFPIGPHCSSRNITRDDGHTKRTFLGDAGKSMVIHITAPISGLGNRRVALHAPDTLMGGECEIIITLGPLKLPSCRRRGELRSRSPAGTFGDGNGTERIPPLIAHIGFAKTAIGRIEPIVDSETQTGRPGCHQVIKRLLFMVRQDQSERRHTVATQVQRWQTFLGVVKILNGKAVLLEMRAALHTPGGFPGGLNGRQKKGDQRADDRDDHKKFNERERDEPGIASPGPGTQFPARDLVRRAAVTAFYSAPPPCLTKTCSRMTSSTIIKGFR